MVTETYTTVNPGYRYTLTRELNAPPAKVWALWTEPDHFAVWFNAAPSSVHLDVRPGGTWRATLITPDGAEYPLTGSYGDVVVNRHLVTLMDIPGRREPAAMDLRLHDLGTRTRLVLSQVADTAEESDEARQGSEILLAAFTSHVAEQA
jgi:uncharacterized protein YndB with AHSA1/START domain